MSDLPAGWEWATLGELIGKDGLFTDGDWVESKDQDPAGEVRLVQLADVGEAEFRDRSDRSLTRLKAQELRCTFLRPGDILVARMPDPLGRACIYPGESRPAVTVVDVCVLRPGGFSIDHKWLMHFLNSPPARSQVADLATGTTRRRISRRNLSSIRVPAPPVAEQKRIVAVLEDHLSRIDAGGSYLTSAEAQAERLARSMTTAVVSASHRTAAPARIGEIATVFSGLTPLRSRSDYYDGGTVPWITSAQVNQGVITQADRFVTDKALSETSLRIVPAGAVLVAMYGEGKTRGRTAELAFPATTNQACAAIVLREEFQQYRRWIKIFLDSRYEANRRLASGGVQPNLSVGLIKSMSVPLPLVETLDSVVDDITEKQSELRRLRTGLDDARHKAARLHRSLLTEAFAGRLVAQDPDDEPVSVLLDRIRAERATQPKPRRSRRTAAP